MIDLRRFFLNPFLDEGISIDETVNYTSNHLSRTIANNPGAIFNTIITATTTKLNALDATLTDETGKLGIQKAKTLAKTTFRDGLPKDIAKIHGDFVASFGPDSPEVTDAFPEGREIFHTADDSLLENKLQALNGKVTTYAASLKPAIVTLAGNLVSIWIALYAAATTGRAGRETSAEARRAALLAMKDQLFTNLLTIANQFHNQEDKAALYCPQHFLEDPAPVPTPTPTPTPTPPP
jgi:hypothetical protein